MNESPQDRLGYYVDGHVKLVRELGGVVDGGKATRDIAKILDIADRQMAEHPVLDVRGEKDPAAVRENKRMQGPEALAEATGGEFFYGDERVEPLISVPKAAPQVPRGLEGEKHFALMTRLRMLMAKIPGAKANPLKPDAEFQFPRFARLLERTTAHAQLHDAKSTGSGIYKGMALPERQRRYYRRLEQICDQSNAVIGRGWWIVK